MSINCGAPFVGLLEAPARIGELPRELLEHIAQYFDLPSAVAFCKSSTSGKSAARAAAFRVWACRACGHRTCAPSAVVCVARRRAHTRPVALLTPIAACDGVREDGRGCLRGLDFVFGQTGVPLYACRGCGLVLGVSNPTFDAEAGGRPVIALTAPTLKLVDARGRRHALGGAKPLPDAALVTCGGRRASGEACGQALFSRDQVLSRLHRWDVGRGGEEAWLVNAPCAGACVELRERTEPLAQGAMRVADAHCARCGARCGWKFVADGLVNMRRNAEQVGRWGFVRSAMAEEVGERGAAEDGSDASLEYDEHVEWEALPYPVRAALRERYTVPLSPTSRCHADRIPEALRAVLDPNESDIDQDALGEDVTQDDSSDEDEDFRWGGGAGEDGAAAFDDQPAGRSSIY